MFNRGYHLKAACAGALSFASRLAVLVACLLLAASSPVRADILYVSNNGNPKSIQKYTGDGVGSYFATGMAGATGLAFDREAELYLADQGDNSITEYDPFGVGTFFADTGLSSPFALAFDRAGNLYVTSQGTHTIEKFTPDGVGSVFHDYGAANGGGLAFDRDGNLYAANITDKTIEKFTPAGVGSLFASLPYEPRGLAFDIEGNLWVTDSFNGLGYIPPGGGYRTYSRGGFLNNPYGLAFDGVGNLYVALAGSNVILKVVLYPNRVISVFADVNDGLSVPVFLAFTDDAGVPLPLPPLPPLCDLLEQLAQRVFDLNLQRGISNSLDAKLGAALQAADDINQNNDVAAINSLQAFVNAVQAQSGNQIPSEAAADLVNAAQEIIYLLNSAYDGC